VSNLVVSRRRFAINKSQPSRERPLEEGRAVEEEEKKEGKEK